jgi:HD-like signal output (HDOD) protein
MAKFARDDPAMSCATSRGRGMAPSPNGERTSQVHKILDLDSAGSLAEYQRALQQRLLGLFAEPNYQPPVLPVMALKLLHLSRKAETNISDLVTLLEMDPVITADVLRLAQSAAFSSGQEPKSIHDCITRIGLRRAGDLFLHAALDATIFRAPGYEQVLERLRRHSVATGEIARMICKPAGLDDNYAYMCGLLHDIGIAGAIISIGGKPGTTAPIEFKNLWPVLSSIHAQFTIQLAMLWNLPIELRAVLQHHHTFAIERSPHPIAAVTILAEIIAAGTGSGFEDEESTCLLSKAVESLNLNVSELEAIEARARAQMPPA